MFSILLKLVVVVGEEKIFLIRTYSAKGKYIIRIRHFFVVVVVTCIIKNFFL